MAAPFVLSRASMEDLEEIIALEYTCFPDWICKIFMGASSKDDLSKTYNMYRQHMLDDPNEVWIKVTDRESKSIIAASCWKAYVNSKSNGGRLLSPPSWLEGELLEKSKKIFKQDAEMRAKVVPGPFVHLHICFTSPAHRRRGAGAMMLQWGCNLADQLGVPAWVEASEEGNYLYKAFGFYDFEKIVGELEGTYMKRDPKLEIAQGGRP